MSRGIVTARINSMDAFHLPPLELLTDLCRRWQILELSVFGSVARGASRTDDNIDLLATFHPDAPWSTLDLVDLHEELALLFCRKVNFVEEKAIRNPYRKASILRDKSVLYAA